MANRKLTIDNCGLDLETLYYRRAGGESWDDLQKEQPVGSGILPRLVNEWAKANDKPKLPKRINSYTILTDINLVDKGKARALRKAGWPVYEIAVECRCEEELIRRYLDDQALL